MGSERPGGNSVNDPLGAGVPAEDHRPVDEITRAYEEGLEDDSEETPEEETAEEESSEEETSEEAPEEEPEVPSGLEVDGRTYSPDDIRGAFQRLQKAEAQAQQMGQQFRPFQQLLQNPEMRARIQKALEGTEAAALFESPAPMDPRVENMVRQFEEQQANQKIDEIIGGFRDRYGDIVTPEMEQAIFQRANESHSKEGGSPFAHIRAAAAELVAEAGKQKWAESGRTEAVEALKKKGPSARIIPSSPQRGRERPKTVRSNADIESALMDAAFGE